MQSPTLFQQMIGFFANHSTSDLIWLTIGFGGQLLFAMRFIMQWICSEKQRKSVIPITFWYFSILGSAVLLLYAIHKKDVVFISGQLFGFIVYARNLYFIFGETEKNKAAALPESLNDTQPTAPSSSH